MDIQELQILSSACPLMMLYISMKFHENVLNSFQVIEETKSDHCQITKGNNSKKCIDMSYSSACCLMMLYISLVS